MNKDSFLDYVDGDYLPGQIYRYTRGSMARDPALAGKYKEANLYKFKEEEAPNRFEEFMKLMNNPDSLINDKIKLPPMFPGGAFG